MKFAKSASLVQQSPFGGVMMARADGGRPGAVSLRADLGSAGKESDKCAATCKIPNWRQTALRTQSHPRSTNTAQSQCRAAWVACRVGHGNRDLQLGQGHHLNFTDRKRRCIMQAVKNSCKLGPLLLLLLLSKVHVSIAF